MDPLELTDQPDYSLEVYLCGVVDLCQSEEDDLTARSGRHELEECQDD